MECSRSHHNNWAKDRKNYPEGAGHPGIIYHEMHYAPQPQPLPPLVKNYVTFFTV